MALRGAMVTADGKHRVHQVRVDGVEKLRIEASGMSQGSVGPRGLNVWYHVADVTRPQEVARHVDIASLRPAE